jgi:acetyl-CoA acetyltransferase
MTNRVSLGNRVIVSDIGQTEFSKASGRSTLQLAAEAAVMALKDSGLAPRESMDQ